MRPFMQKRIDALHAEIARLVEVEKAWQAKAHPPANSMWAHVQRTQVEVAAWPPHLRQGAQLQGRA